MQTDKEQNQTVFLFTFATIEYCFNFAYRTLRRSLNFGTHIKFLYGTALQMDHLQSTLKKCSLHGSLLYCKSTIIACTLYKAMFLKIKINQKKKENFTKTCIIKLKKLTIKQSRSIPCLQEVDLSLTAVLGKCAYGQMDN